MILTWQHLIIINIVVQFNYVVGQTPKYKLANPKDWKLVESLAEEYPYIVALLNRNKEYTCTGVIVNKNTALTSGSCIDPALQYIAVGSAVLRKNINNKTLFVITRTRLHADYIFELKPKDPNVTRMHSNIGLVFSALPNLEAYIPHADLGNYFASELEDKHLKVVGYGNIKETNMIVLQHQSYHQSPCTNPKWYYCICGIEFSIYGKTYDQEFGKGAPVFFGNEVIGIAATPSGLLEMSSEGIKYNIFTVIGPYLPWVEKVQPPILKPVFRIATTTTTSSGHRDTGIYCVYIWFTIGKVIY